MAAEKQIKINLLPKGEFEASLLGRLLRWALSSFRIIVIVTEMVVMAAFLSRFWLDAQNSDLNALIEEKVAIIQAFNDIENEFRLVQKKIGIFSDFKKIPLTSEKLHTITAYLPADVTLISVAKDTMSVQIKGASASEQSISQYIVNLQAQKELEKVELQQIGSDKENPAYIVFTLKTTWH